jgi:hypothetical protein
MTLVLCGIFSKKVCVCVYVGVCKNAPRKALDQYHAMYFVIKWPNMHSVQYFGLKKILTAFWMAQKFQNYNLILQLSCLKKTLHNQSTINKKYMFPNTNFDFTHPS